MKKLLFVILTLILLLSLFGCAKSDDNLKAEKLDANGNVMEVDVPSDVPVVILVDGNKQGHLVAADGEDYVAK